MVGFGVDDGCVKNDVGCFCGAGGIVGTYFFYSYFLLKSSGLNLILRSLLPYANFTVSYAVFSVSLVDVPKLNNPPDGFLFSLTLFYVSFLPAISYGSLKLIVRLFYFLLYYVALPNNGAFYAGTANF